MLKIRLSRVGKKKQPYYRVVVADARAARDGAFVEVVGHYNPRTEPTTFEVDVERVRSWLSKGAQPTLIVEKLLARRGLLPARSWSGAGSKAAAPQKSRPQASAPAEESEPQAPAAEAEV